MTRRMNWLVVMIIVMTSGLAHAARLNFKPLNMAVNAGDRLVIQGFKGSIRLQAADRLGTMTVNLTQDNPDKAPDVAKRLMDEWSFTLQREGSTIYLRVLGPQSKEDWQELLMAGGWPSFLLEIQSPSLPTEIFWGEGPITINNWKANLLVNSQGGNLNFLNGKGDLKVYVQDGFLSIKDHDGQVRAESYRAKVEASGLKGVLDLENFAGESLVQNFSGQMTFASFRGNSALKKLKGRLEFDNGKAGLNIDAFEGELRGKSGEGSITASLVGEADVRIKTKEGNVFLKPINSGARVNVGTVEGKMAVPTYLSNSRSPHLEVRQGELRGANKGSIFVRTETGNIRIQ